MKAVNRVRIQARTHAPSPLPTKPRAQKTRPRPLPIQNQLEVIHTPSVTSTKIAEIKTASRSQKPPSAEWHRREWSKNAQIAIQTMNVRRVTLVSTTLDAFWSEFMPLDIHLKRNQDAQQTERASLGRASQNRPAKRTTSTCGEVSARINVGGSRIVLDNNSLNPTRPYLQRRATML